MTAQGLADAVLTGNPQVTFWRFVAKAYTNFALETQLLDFTAGVPNFGAFPKCNLDRIGDLVYWMYVVFDLPGIGAIKYNQGGEVLAIQDGNLRPFWTRAIGQALIESANFFIGGQNIDYMKGEFLFIWEELTGQPGKRLIEMTGNYRTLNALQTASMQPRRLYVPLPFWFTMNSGLALPLVSLQFHSVAVSIKLRPLQYLLKFTHEAMLDGYAINLSAKGVFNRPYFDANDYAVFPNQIAQPVTDLQLNIQNTDLMAYIECCYVYLDQRERSKFADGAFEQLMVEHQETSTQIDNQISTPLQVGNSAKRINFELNFNHTIIGPDDRSEFGDHAQRLVQRVVQLLRAAADGHAAAHRPHRQDPAAPQQLGALWRVRGPLLPPGAAVAAPHQHPHGAHLLLLLRAAARGRAALRLVQLLAHRQHQVRGHVRPPPVLRPVCGRRQRRQLVRYVPGVRHELEYPAL